MTRFILAVSFIATVLASSAASMAMAAEPAPGRYQIDIVAGGFVRLDTATGAMTFCRDGADSPICGPLDQTPTAAAKEAPPVDGKQDVQSFDEALSMAEKAMRSFMAIAREDKRDCTL